MYERANPRGLKKCILQLHSYVFHSVLQVYDYIFLAHSLSYYKTALLKLGRLLARRYLAKAGVHFLRL